ncbi:MAG: hypothetical protein MMC33_000625 [Icmadophila ericetorum]|nr:hypothetical protein [Icmadophila ericetorum]
MYIPNSHLLALGTLFSSVSATVYKGFDYGTTFTNGAAKALSDFEAEFTTAQQLVGTSGFSSARLYTMIQGGTQDTVLSAIPAAINTKTSLLLGVWASQNQDGFNNELAALTTAIQQFGAQLGPLCVGISVGSEDLYRISPIGIENMSGVGANPDTIISYISQVRNVIKGTQLAGCPVGHVDTWTAWVNGTNFPVITASDFLGMDAYPYFQNTEYNDISVGYPLLFEAYGNTTSVAQGKPVWVTETGWPVSGSTEGNAVPSIQNAQTYWDQVGCALFGNINTWWYALQDAAPTTPNPSFGIVGSTLSDTPLFDLSCGAQTTTTSTTAKSTTSTPTSQKQTSTEQQTSNTQQKETTITKPTTTAVVPPPTPTTLKTSTVSIVSPPPFTSTLKTSTTTAAPPPPATSTAPAQSCPTTLTTGSFEFPHLIVPVNSAEPTTAYGTSYDGTFSSTISTLFNFDIPPTDAGKTCSLIFLLPEQSQLSTSSFTLTGTGGLDIALLSSPALQTTTFDTVPAASKNLGTIASVTPGNSYVIATGVCPAGEKIGYEVKATGSLDLTYFQDYSQPGIGLYITVCN